MSTLVEYHMTNPPYYCISKLPTSLTPITKHVCTFTVTSTATTETRSFTKASTAIPPLLKLPLYPLLLLVYDPPPLLKLPPPLLKLPSLLYPLLLLVYDPPPLYIPVVCNTFFFCHTWMVFSNCWCCTCWSHRRHDTKLTCSEQAWDCRAHS